MTDPSYRGQILVFTTPLIGNYGVPRNTAPYDSREVGVVLESAGIQCAGVIVADVAEKFSHFTAVESISSWCESRLLDIEFVVDHYDIHKSIPMCLEEIEDAIPLAWLEVI